MQDRSVAVIGGGIVGLCTAFHLAKRGASVTVIDRALDGLGASWGNAGSVSPGSVLPVAYRGMLRDVPQMLTDPHGPLRVTASGLWNHSGWLLKFLRQASERRIRASAGAIASMVQVSLKSHVDLLDSVDSSDLLRTSGQLHIYPDRRALGRDRFGWSLRKEFGVEMRELDRHGILEIEPSIGPAYNAGMFLPRQGMIVDPGEYGARLRSVLRQAGVRLIEDEVKALKFDDHDKPQVIGRQSTHAFSDVVLCAGSWSVRLLEQHGYEIPLINQRGFHVQFENAGVSLERVVVLADRKVFVTPMTNGVRAAGTVEITALDSKVDMGRADALIAHMRAAWPKLNETPNSKWSGERPCLPDSLPVMGRSDHHPNLWFNFGHGHLGLTLAAIAGAEISRSMAQGSATPMIRHFDYRRFAG